MSYEEALQLFDLRTLVERYLIKQSVELLNNKDFEYLSSLIDKQKTLVRMKTTNGSFHLIKASTYTATSTTITS